MSILKLADIWVLSSRSYIVLALVYNAFYNDFTRLRSTFPKGENRFRCAKNLKVIEHLLISFREEMARSFINSPDLPKSLMLRHA